MPLGCSKNILVAGDKWRGRGQLWDNTGTIPFDFTKPITGNPFTLRLQSDSTKIAGTIPRLYSGKDYSPTDMRYHAAFFIPSSVAPGQYYIDMYSSIAAPSPPELLVPITVLAPLKARPVYPVSPSTPLSLAQSAMSAGWDLLLQPGLHEWPTGTLTTQPYSNIRGYGATVLREGNETEIFSLSDGTLFEGINFIGENGVRVYDGVQCATRMAGYYQGFWNYGVCIIRCGFENLTPGVIGNGVYVESCTVKGGGAPAGPGLYRNLKLIDTRYAEAMGLGGPGADTFALIDAEFSGTDRGPCLNAFYGDIKNMLLLGTWIHDTLWVENGSESFLCEPNIGTNGFGWYDSLIFHTRIWNSGTCLQLDGTAKNLLMWDTYMNNCAGMCLWGGAVSDIKIDQFECRNGARLLLGPTNNVSITNGAFVAYNGGRWNEQWTNGAAWYGMKSPVQEFGPILSKGTIFNNIDFQLMPGQTPFDTPSNYSPVNCRVNGVPYVQGA